MTRIENFVPPVARREPRGVNKAYTQRPEFPSQKLGMSEPIMNKYITRFDQLHSGLQSTCQNICAQRYGDTTGYGKEKVRWCGKIVTLGIPFVQLREVVVVFRNKNKNNMLDSWAVTSF
ncbi:MAG: hypothetical protein V1492_01810 [Candidatus Micrarchaeota archaeon]